MNAELESRIRPTGTNGARPILQDAVHVPQLPALTLWERFTQIFRWENLIVGGKEVKGFVVPQWAAVILLTAIIGGAGFMYRGISTEQTFQHDALIKLTTQREDDQKNAAAAAEAARQEEGLARLWREKYDKRMARVEDKLRVKGDN